MRLLWVVCITAACQTHPESWTEVIQYGHLSVSAETLPVWDDACLQKASVFIHWAISLVLQRDQVLDVPEWVSGHRYALTAACETFSPELLIIETPPNDTLFYPADSFAREAWQSTLQTWLLYELIPTISTYPSVQRVAWGKGFTDLALPEGFWEKLLRAARRAAPHLQWGFISDKPASIPLYPYWDFIGVFVKSETSPDFPLPPHQKPIFYFLTGEGFNPHSLPLDTACSLVFYSKHHWPITCE